MAKAFEEQLQMIGIDELGFGERLGLLVDREMTERGRAARTSRLPGKPGALKRPAPRRAR